MKTNNQRYIFTKRVNNSLLVKKANSVKQVLNHSLGVQAQYKNHGLFNILTRIKLGTSALLISSELEQIILAWGQRQTLHFYDYKDWQALSFLLLDRPRWPVKYLKEYDLALDDQISKLENCFLDREAISREELRTLYGDDYDILLNWSCILLESSCRGHLFSKANNIEKGTKFFWERQLMDFAPRENLKIKFLRRYFSAYGPATKKDAAHFFGVPLHFFAFDLKEHFASFILEQRELFYVKLDPESAPPEVVLLGKFDPLLVGYADKDLMCTKKEQESIWRKGGQISAVLYVQGIFSGVWNYKIRGKQIFFYLYVHVKIDKTYKLKISRKLEIFSALLKKK